MLKFSKIYKFVCEGSENVDATDTFETTLDNFILTRSQIKTDGTPKEGELVWLEITGNLNLQAGNAKDGKSQMAGMFKVTKATKSNMTLEPHFKSETVNEPKVVDAEYKRDETETTKTPPGHDEFKDTKEPKAEKVDDKLNKAEPAKVDPLVINFDNVSKMEWTGNTGFNNPQWYVIVLDYEKPKDEFESEDKVKLNNELKK